tara:strand:+ start:19288 stop:19917 length:630 start_codon:yes stop_codon:yes gene_type:complete
MSVQMSHAGWQITGLTPTKKIILLLLCNYADENNQCYPSHRHIADKVGLKDTKGVQRTIKEFEELGLLSIEHRKTANGGFTSNRYTLLLPMGANTTRVVKTVSDTVVEPDNTKEDTKTLYTKEFQVFWSDYPRKIGKYASAKSFKKALKVINALELQVACINYAKYVEDNKVEQTFIPHATTWLNNRRWEDYKEYKPKSQRSDKGFLQG